MKRVKSLVFNTFNFKSNSKENDISFFAKSIFDIPFDESHGYGFSDVEVEGNILTAKVLKRTSTFIQDYDESVKEIVKKQVYIFSDIQFSIDFEYSVLYVIGGTSQMNNVKSIFRKAFDFDYDLNQIELSPFGFYDLLKEKNVDFNIEQIIINRFNYNNGIVGRLNGHITDQTVGADLISEYKNDVIKISFGISIDDDDQLVMQVLPNASLKLLAEESNLDYYLTYIKSLIFS